MKFENEEREKGGFLIDKDSELTPKRAMASNSLTILNAANSLYFGDVIEILIIVRFHMLIFQTKIGMVPLLSSQIYFRLIYKGENIIKTNLKKRT